MKPIILLALFLLPAPLFAADPWTTEEIVLEATFQTLLAIDWAQSHEIVDRPKIEEDNSILGLHPTHREVDGYILLSSAAHVITTHLLPSEYRRQWILIWIGFELIAIEKGYRQGLTIFNGKF